MINYFYTASGELKSKKGRFWDTPFDELFQGTEMHKASKSFKVAPCLQHQVEATWSQKEVVCCLKI